MCAGSRARSSATATARRGERRLLSICSCRSAQQARQSAPVRPDETLRRARHRGRQPLAAQGSACASRSGSSCCSRSRSCAATTLGANDGLASFYWGSWRLDLSLNFFVLLLVGTCFLLVAVIAGRSIALVGLPQRAREWRTRGATAPARPRCAMRWRSTSAAATRARQKSAQRALAIQAETPELAQDNEFTVLGHLLAAGSAHRLQNRALRDEELRRALELSRAQPRGAPGGRGRASARRRVGARRSRRGARDRAAQRPAARRRATHACAAAEAAGGAYRAPAAGGAQTARLLIKHQGFSPVAAAGLVRSLAFESLETRARRRAAAPALDVARPCRPARPVHRRARGDVRGARSARNEDARALAAAALGTPRRARRPRSAQPSPSRSTGAVRGIGADWLPRLETAAQTLATRRRDRARGRQRVRRARLWGKASACSSRPPIAPTLAAPTRRKRLDRARRARRAERATRRARAATRAPRAVG